MSGAGVTEERAAEELRGREFDRWARTRAGRDPAEYPKLVASWNVAIGMIHGRPFDPSHDRERGSSG